MFEPLSLSRQPALLFECLTPLCGVIALGHVTEAALHRQTVSPLPPAGPSILVHVNMGTINHNVYSRSSVVHVACRKPTLH